MNARELFAMLMEYPQPTRTEVLTELETLTLNYDQEHTTALLSDFKDMFNEWKYNKVVARLEAEYNEKILAPYYTALHNAEYALAMGSNDPIEWPEDPVPFGAPPPFPGCYDEGFIFVAPMYEYAVEVLKNHAPNNQDSNNSTGLSISPEFSTETAQIIFGKLTENGYCSIEGDRYKWEKSTALLAYCIDEMSHILELRPSNDRIPWSKFKSVFGLDEKTIRTCRNEVSKYTTTDKKGAQKDKPEGWRELDAMLR